VFLVVHDGFCRFLTFMTSEEEEIEVSTMKEAKNRLLDFEGLARYKTDKILSGTQADETSSKDVFVLTSMDDLVVSGF
jgi:hypothetical protein